MYTKRVYTLLLCTVVYGVFKASIQTALMHTDPCVQLLISRTLFSWGALQLCRTFYVSSNL